MLHFPNSDTLCSHTRLTLFVHNHSRVRGAPAKHGANADKIAVLAQGAVVEQGTHEDLMLARGSGAKSGVYANMWASQQAEIETEHAYAQAKQKSAEFELELK